MTTATKVVNIASKYNLRFRLEVYVSNEEDIFIKFDEIKNKLKEGEKYTLWGFDTPGLPYSLQMRHKECKYEPYAQNRDMFIIVFKPKHCKYYRKLRMHNVKTLIIWEGWVKPDDDTYPTKGRKGLIGWKMSRPGFDVGYIKAALESVENEPIILVGVQK